MHSVYEKSMYNFITKHQSNFIFKPSGKEINNASVENSKVARDYKLKPSLSEENTMYKLASSNIKVSIIIPVYNVERYLKQCLNSVVNQTLKEIEIICVNDGSTNHSPQILEEYAKKDERIKVVHKKNAGLGAARNTGIGYAKGEYIGFVDSDDWIDITMFRKLYENAQFYNSDIVMCPMLIVNETNEELNNLPYYDLDCFNEDFNNSVFGHEKTKDFILKIAVNAYNKIYRTEFINKINAKFPEGLIFEDNPFFYHTYLNAMSVSLIRDFLYFHRVNRKDSITSKAGKRFFDIVEIKNQIIQSFLLLPNFEDYEKDLLNNKIKGIIHRYFQVSDISRQEFFELIKQDFTKMNLKNDEIDNLQLIIKRDYLDVINSNSHIEFELLKERNKLLNTVDKLTTQNKQLLKNNDKLKSNSNKLKNQLNLRTNEMAEYLTLFGYFKYKSKNIAFRIWNMNPYMAILSNKNNHGIKNALINIKGYRAIKKDNLFDIGYYLNNNDDVRLSGRDPILHYMYQGFNEGRKPNPSFDGDYYLKKHNDVTKSNLNPLVHYSLYGLKEGRKTTKDDLN